MNTQPSRSLPWVSVVCFVLLTAIEVARVIQQGVGGGTLTALLLALLFISCLFAYFDIRDFLRLRAVTASHPAAFVAHIVIYPELVAQLDKLAEIVGCPPLKVRSGRHGTIAVDATTFGVFGGYAKPEELFATSGLRLRSARIARSQQGLWKLPCLELEYEAGQDSVVIDLSIMRVRFGIPRVVSKRVLERILPDVMRLMVVRK